MKPHTQKRDCSIHCR